MIPNKTLKLSLKSLREFAKKRLPDDELIDLDARDECPLEIVRHMCSPDKLGIQLLFIPEEFGGLGGGAFDVYCVCEEMARIDLGIATAVLATFLGSDPITVGATVGTEEIVAHAHRGRGIAVCLRRHGTGSRQRSGGASNHGRAGHRKRQNRGLQNQSGNKQWISNGGIADAYTILANTPSGPSWFIVEKDVKGFTHDKPEDKHGIRLSNTAALALDNVYVDVGRLVGGVEGQGLNQAQAVFGYTRLMVAAFGLGGGWAALDRAIPYSTQAHSSGSSALRKTGIHAQANRPHMWLASKPRAPSSKKPRNALMPAKAA